MRRYGREHPGELIHFDVKKLGRFVRPGHRITGGRQKGESRGGAGHEFLKESFAGGTALTRAITGADTNPLVKAVVTDFSTSEGRSAARDGLKVKFASRQPSGL